MFLRLLIIGVVLSVAVGGGLAWVFERPRAAAFETVQRIVQPLADSKKIGGPFVLTDHKGRTVTDKDFRGRYLLVYFGYSYCSDVCQAELQIMSAALDKLGKDAPKVQPLFVTLDPERDTVKVLAEYIPHFHPQLLGLTGTMEQIARVAREYRVFFAKVPADGDDKPYTMSHSSWMYFMAPDGKCLDRYAFGTNPDAIASDIRAHL